MSTTKMTRCTMKWRVLLIVMVFAGLAEAGHAATVSPLFARGYDVIPEPQQVELTGGDFEFGSGWRLELGPGVSADDIAVETLKAQLSKRDGVMLEGARSGAARGRVIRLAIQAGSVSIGAATDKNKAAIEEQAYRLELGSDGIRITASAPVGLFYGVDTLVQLMKPARGKLWLPTATIVDWPDVEYREIFWDEQKHLDHFDVLEQAVRRAAFFKANALSLRLNDHFEYASAPALVDPYALSPAQLQELTDYGLRYHVQVVPYLDGPAHTDFILERHAYGKLREFPQMAFEMCSTNAETYKLLEGMYQDLMNANKGATYFHLSTDEAWFVGLAHNAQCDEAARAKELGSPSKLLVEFTQKTATYLHDHGRQVIFWGEYPLQAKDIPLEPSWLINGEVYGPVYNKAFKAHGIRQMIYTSTQPDDPLFPAYYVLSPEEQVHPRRGVEERATQVFDQISYTSARQEADLIGVDIYAWGDYGPHPATFWLGYAVGSSAAWHPGSPDPHELMHSFYRLFYGRGPMEMGQLYRLMSTQAQFFGSSWDRKPSAQLPLVFGYSYGIGPFTPDIQTLPLPPLPSADYLHLGHNWLQGNTRRVKLAWKFLGENDELMNLLYKNLGSVEFNRYNLEVYLSIAGLCRQNLLLLTGLDEINHDLEVAQADAAKLHYADAVGALDEALDTAGEIRDERNQALHDATTTWSKTWFPRVREANGRHVARDPEDFVDTATSEDARRSQVGLLYLIDREFLLPFGQWVNQLQGVRNHYAAAHNLPAREGSFDWQDTTTLDSQPSNRSL
ncbi:MAG: glycoside hydrolase family 20 zincin-like fold domain-containing protein [Terriglobia bacterium]